MYNDLQIHVHAYILMYMASVLPAPSVHMNKDYKTFLKIFSTVVSQVGVPVRVSLILFPHGFLEIFFFSMVDLGLLGNSQTMTFF